MYHFSSLFIAGESGETIFYQVRSAIPFQLDYLYLTEGVLLGVALHDLKSETEKKKPGSVLKKKLEEFLRSSILLVAARYWSDVQFILQRVAGIVVCRIFQWPHWRIVYDLGSLENSL